MKKTLLTLLIGTGLMLSAPAYAHEGEDHHMEGMKGTETPAASPHNAFTTLDKGYADLQSAIAAGSFDTIHETVEGMEPALASLKAAHEDDAGITGTVDMIVKALSDLHTAGDAKDTAKMQEQLKKLDGGLKLLKARLPDEHSKNTGSSSFTATAEGFDTLKANQENRLTIKLTDESGTPLSLDRLQEVHTQKVHFLIIDESLSDYHHLHPEAGTEPGIYIASFTPEKADTYKLWADVTPVGGSQRFISVPLKGEKSCESLCVEKTVASEGMADGLKAILSFEKPLKAGEADMGMVKITDEAGNAVTNLEPVMGAFAHIVGFYEDFNTIAHVHPMGKEPSSDSERGGPDLSFHFEPVKTGFVKIFVQVRRGEKDIFIPLGIEVQ